MPHHGNISFTPGATGLSLEPSPVTNEISKDKNVHVKPTARKFDHRFSAEGLSLAPTPLKDTVKTLDFAKMIPLGNGRPASEMLPWEELTMRVAKRDTGLMSCVKGESSFDLAVALDYGCSGGSTKLVDFLTEHVESIHHPPYSDWQTCLSIGSTSAIERALRLFCNRGDWILVEEYTYSGLITAGKTLGINMLAIEMDDGGLNANDLDAKLSAWGPEKGKKPFVLYTVPSGQNPTGKTQSVQRKRLIYEVAEKHDLYIVEDDPYYFLQHGNFSKGTSNLTAKEYQTHLPATYLSLDLSGRVLRLDSASKILAPGLRLGWVTGCAQVIGKFIEQADMSTLAASGPSQVMVHKLLCETWGHGGFMNWLFDLSLQYRKRRDTMSAACAKYLPSVCHWTLPAVGMFLWIKVDHTQLSSRSSPLALEEKICEELEGKGLMVGRGSWFWVGSESMNELCFRLTFAAAPQERLEQAIRILAEQILLYT
ncbi:aromatic aminotransferase Aro8 [Penicillium canariense]|uniref:Aromatic aminotransferase Aro8 n=1 Tax=Penicillium canariense TaxID=189055 RepID=A0A9W9LIE2_9EURO|nr:aromatic aminotransferase Aro8 [Penicillium canariense]KAJ5157394.1 aromatic aminotransferase Aro8 [Penicillium canariense]